MSYTTFQGTAICKVPSFFNLDRFIERLHLKCINEDNFIVENYGVLEVDNIESLEDGTEITNKGKEVDIDFNEYIRQYGDKIYINVDSEETDSDVWDWLIDQFISEMTSNVMVVKSATVDSRSGVDITFTLYNKIGDRITLNDLIENYPGLDKNSYELY